MHHASVKDRTGKSLKGNSMKVTKHVAGLIIILTGSLPLIFPAHSDAAAFRYPEARISDQTDDYFGTAVADPYRWLEEVDSDETLEWIESENLLTFNFLESIPERETILERLSEIWDYPSCSLPSVYNGRYFYRYNEGLQEFSVLYYKDGLDGEPHVLIDPNEFHGEGDVSLSGTSISRDGRLIAWSISESGSDWSEWRVREVDTGEDLDDLIRWTKFSYVAWNSDNSGFYYSRYPETASGEELVERNQNQIVCFHRLGTAQDEDEVVYSRPDEPDWTFYCWLTDDYRYLGIDVDDGEHVSSNGLLYMDLENGNGSIVELLSEFDSFYWNIGNIGSEFYFITDLDAPNSRIVSIDVTDPDRGNWREEVPEKEEVLLGASIQNDSTIVAVYSKDAFSKVLMYDLSGEFLRELELPCPGSVYGFGGLQSQTESFYSFSSFLYPSEIYRYDFETDESTLYWRPEIDADLSQYVTEQVFYSSYDGTRIPMFLVYPEIIRLDGSNPCLLTGYGGFGVSMGPWFSSSNIVWMEMGGIYAVPCIRGGGEYGEDWHLAGVRENRSKVFDDFICAAEYLIENGYTSTPRLAISGGSNGGTLVGACLNRRPDLFGAALPGMGVMDLLRYHLFTVGYAWIPEYGNPGIEEDFQFLYRYSPYHNIAEGVEYPPVLVTTADHDDRVVPGHSFKYAARLQAAQAGEAPILIRIQGRAGHGGGVGISEYMQLIADEYAFLAEVLDI
jgi:prolyl oligopeptidase